jgi:hypothetical protein
MTRLAIIIAVALTASLVSAQKPETLKQLNKDLLVPINPDTSTNYTPPPPDDLLDGSISNYCVPSPNSFGLVAIMTGSGSLDVTQHTFQLSVSGLPPNPLSFGMFTYGPNTIDVPFACGRLCISPFFPGITRMAVQSLTGSGTVARSAADHPTDFAAFTPASIWYFQFWYRDPNGCSAAFNLSDGLAVHFAN